MTLNQIIQWAKDNEVDFDSQLVMSIKDMEYTTFQHLASLKKTYLKKVKKSCTDAFDYTNYTKEVMVETEADPDSLECYKVEFREFK